MMPPKKKITGASAGTSPRQPLAFAATPLVFVVAATLTLGAATAFAGPGRPAAVEPPATTYAAQGQIPSYQQWQRQEQSQTAAEARRQRSGGGGAAAARPDGESWAGI